MKPMHFAALALGVAGTFAVTSAQAVPVLWTDWTASGANTVTGTITLPDSSTIDVTYTGGYFFAQTAGGTNYWSPDVYSNATVDNAPPTPDIIAIGTGRGGVLSFSRPVANLFLAMVSINGPGVSFDHSFDVLSSGCGFWGCGTLTFNPGNALSTVGGAEGHGTIRFQGSFDTLVINEAGFENWRGFTVGVEGLAPAQGAPAPGALALLGLGLAGLGLARRRA